jgi:hypothetical protein
VRCAAVDSAQLNSIHLPHLRSIPRSRGRCRRAHAADLGCIFRARRARKHQGNHQIAGLEAFLEGCPRKEQAVGAHLIDRWQSNEGEMKLRQRFFACAPQFPGAANLFDDAFGNRFAIGGGQKGKDAPLVAIEGEAARR